MKQLHGSWFVLTVSFLALGACGDSDDGSTKLTDASHDAATSRDGSQDASHDSALDGSALDAAPDASADATTDSSLSSCSAPGDACCEGNVCGGPSYCQGQTCSCIRDVHGRAVLLANGTVTEAVFSPKLIEREDSGQPLSDIVEVFDGHGYGCGLRSDGTVWCWSWSSTAVNGSGALGDGTFNAPSGLRQATQVLTKDSEGMPTPLTDVAHIQSGASRSYLADTNCAVMKNGELRCWGSVGNGGGGQVYNDGETGNRAFATPIFASEGVLLDKVEQVSMGRRHYCVVRTPGELWCWGAGVYGALGFGSEDSVVYPTKVDLPGTVFQVGAGSDSTCARVNDGVYCWGSNSHGQVGTGDPADSCGTRCTSPQRVITTDDTNLEDVVELGVIYHGACVIKSNHDLHCWGSGAGSKANPLEDLDGDPITQVARFTTMGSSLLPNLAHLTTDDQLFLRGQVSPMTQPCGAVLP